MSASSGPSSSVPASPPEGRREAQRRRKTAAIVEAATRLFRARGYDGVTTQEIAEEAGVTNGSFFRHVGSKSDLLIRVVDEQLRSGRDRALQAVRDGAGPAEAILELMVPLRDLSLSHPELATAYVREVLFARTPSTEDSLEQIDRMRAAIETILARTDDPARSGRTAEDHAFASDVVFSSICTQLVRLSLGRTDASRLPETFRRLVGRLVETLGY